MRVGLAARLADAARAVTAVRPRTRLAIVVAALLASACVSMPTGPSVLVLPGTGKDFNQFRADDYECRNYAQSQLGGTAEQAQTESALKSAAIGAAVGAAAGALVGNRHNAGAGAAVGLIGGSAIGASTANASGREAQRIYDNGYQQCMYAKGHRIPVAGRYGPSQPAPAPAAPSAAPVTPPPPPPGSPPPPPRS